MIFNLWRWIGQRLGYIGNHSTAGAAERLINDGRIHGFRLASWALTKCRDGSMNAEAAEKLVVEIRAWCEGRDGCGDLLGFAAAIEADLNAWKEQGRALEAGR